MTPAKPLWVLLTDTRQALIHVVEYQMRVAGSPVLSAVTGKEVPLARSLAAAPPYWFDADFSRLALGQPPVDLQWHPSLLQTPSGFALIGFPAFFEDIPEGTTREVLGPNVALVGFWWIPVSGSNPGTRIGAILSNPDGEHAVAVGVWRQGEWLSSRVAADEDDLLRGSEQHTFRRVLPAITVLIAMANQKIASQLTHHLPRQLRRSGWAKHSEGAVIVVHLRKRAPSESHGEQGGAPEWSHRWIVRGHWRQQFYPTTNTHRPVFIEPYVKGPEGKPLLPKQVQFAVDR